MMVFGQWFHPGVHEVPMSFADSIRMQGDVELLEASEGCGTSAGKSAGVVSSTGGAGAAIDDVASPPPRTIASKSAVGSGWLAMACTTVSAASLHFSAFLPPPFLFLPPLVFLPPPLPPPLVSPIFRLTPFPGVAFEGAVSWAAAHVADMDSV